MFDLEREISSWRKELAGRAGVTETDVDELESHLRDSVDAMSRSMDVETAFRTSIQALGAPEALSEEFKKDGPILPADWMMLLGIASLALCSLFVKLSVFFRFNSGLEEIIKWYYSTYVIGVHLAHIVGGFGAYYIIRYVAYEKEETSFNQLFVGATRSLLPVAAVLVWTAVAIYTLGNGPAFPFHTLRSILLVVGPLVLLPICWSGKLSRVYLAQFVVLFWATTIVAINLKDRREENFEAMLFVAGIVLTVGTLPWLARLKPKKAPDFPNSSAV